MQLKQGAEKERLQSQHWGALLLDEGEADLRTCLPSPFLALAFEQPLWWFRRRATTLIRGRCSVPTRNALLMGRS